VVTVLICFIISAIISKPLLASAVGYAAHKSSRLSWPTNKDIIKSNSKIKLIYSHLVYLLLKHGARCENTHPSKLLIDNFC